MLSRRCPEDNSQSKKAQVLFSLGALAGFLVSVKHLSSCGKGLQQLAATCKLWRLLPQAISVFGPLPA